MFPFGRRRREPLITKELFDQIHVGRVNYKRKWGSKRFAFVGLLTCGKCGSAIPAEERYKLLKDGSYKRHVYYSCAKGKNRTCNQKYFNENDPTEVFRLYVIENETKIKVSYTIQKQVVDHQKLLLHYLPKHGIKTDKTSRLRSYAEYSLASSNIKLIAELVEGIEGDLKMNNGGIETT